MVGACPGGLFAAYHLTRMGHSVEIFEAGAHPGGLLWTGIPDYRLPNSILKAEIDRIVNMGVKIRLNYKATDIVAEIRNGKFNACFLAIGAQLIQQETFEKDDFLYIKDAFSFFAEYKSNSSPYIMKSVVVYGGGKLALYLSRIVKRFNSDVAVYYPGDKKMMPAYDYETDDALAEGVEVGLLKSICSIKDKKIILQKMKVEKGKAVGTGEFETIDTDVLITANRQEIDSAFLTKVEKIICNEDGTVQIDAQRMTGHQGIFAGGDMLPGENRSATTAIGHGKKAAKYINAYLLQQPYIKPEKHLTAGYRKLHIWYQTEAPQKAQEKLQPTLAIKSFDEIIAGLDEPAAKFEAQRCLSCGNCFECDGCFGACPEDAIIKLGKGNRYKYNYDVCTGCAVCFEQCPCHAIEMIAEPFNATTHVK